MLSAYPSNAELSTLVTMFFFTKIFRNSISYVPNLIQDTSWEKGQHKKTQSTRTVRKSDYTTALVLPKHMAGIFDKNVERKKNTGNNK